MIDAVMFLPCKTPEKAIEVSKKAWGFTCCITGQQAGGFAYHGAHLFDRGIPTFAHLKSLPLNIFPMVAPYHVGPDSFDNIPGGGKRYPVTVAYTGSGAHLSKVDWLFAMVDKVCPENLNRVAYQVHLIDRVRVRTGELLAGSHRKAGDCLIEAADSVYAEGIE